ncbi:carbohydrate kinase [Annulohypoxylon moriforme]|nr:carbohydrate kinase [Annulohypoxylon moriforme]
MAQPPKTKRIFVISGLAGSGKTTVASYLSQALSIPYLEEDDYHTTDIKLKIGNGKPLTVDDRWDWLIELRDKAAKRLRSSDAIIVTCSSLGRKCRDVFRVMPYYDRAVRVRFIYLKIDEEQLQERASSRVGHEINITTVRSQMECLEEPAEDESDVVTVDVKEREQLAVCEDALARVGEKFDEGGT